MDKQSDNIPLLQSRVWQCRVLLFSKWGSFWKWYLACGLYITLMSLRNVRAAHSWFLKSWIWKSTWRYGILKLHVLIMQPSVLHNIWKISIEKKRRSEYETNKDIVPRHTRGGGVMNILKSAHERISDASNTIGWCGMYVYWNTRKNTFVMT